MLAGEEFSDHPRCVDPVLAAYLRAFNDRLDHADRQRLYPYASRAVGTRAGRARRRERLDACLAFTGLRSHLLARIRIGLAVGLRWGLHLRQGAGEYAARCAIAEERVDAGFALIDQLIGDGGPAPMAAPRGSEAAPLARPVVVGA
jgi:hypothetical protein